jgi:hypothetical protein
MSTSEKQEAPPSIVTDAVLVPSNEMPKDAQKVEELDFNKFTGRPITVDDLISGMNHMGFQASSIGEAVRIINDMVQPPFSMEYSMLKYPSEHGEIQKPMTRPPSFLATPQILSPPAFEELYVTWLNTNTYPQS